MPARHKTMSRSVRASTCKPIGATSALAALSPPSGSSSESGVSNGMGGAMRFADPTIRMSARGRGDP